MTTSLLLFDADILITTSSGTDLIEGALWKLDTSSNPGHINTTDGFFAHDFVGYGGAVYFDAFAASHSGLWITDGSSAHEITGIANTASGGLSPIEPIVFNNLIYFEGTDSAAHQGLWVSDGTAANTHEIVPANALSSGIFDGPSPDFAVYNGSLYFAGRDASGKTLLWTSDGTAGGTHVVAPVTELEGPEDLISFNGSLYLKGFGPSFHPNLFQSDGTAAGSHELIVAGADPSGLSPSEFAVYTSPTLGTTLLYFNGSNADGRGVLWVTDGTEAGTQEITGIAGASIALNPSDITVYNGRLYFQGSRAPDGELSLWTSDGTAAGTHEIVVPGADYGGSHGGFNPENFTVFNGLLYFDGRADSGVTTGNQVLWVTDGTTVNQVPLDPSAPANPSVGNLFAATFGAPNLPPSVTINQGSGQSDPANSGPIQFDVVFSESVTGFDGSDISFTGSTAPGTLIATVTGSGATYTVSVSGMTGSGTVVAGIGAGRAQDSGGADNTASTSTDNTVTFVVGPPNQAPVNGVPGPQSVNEDTSLVFSAANSNAISISDADAGGGAEQVTLSAAHGALTLATTSGLSFSAGDGTADATMTFTGTVATINAALNGLAYLGNPNYNGADTLTINTNDQGNTGSGGALSDQDTVAITVNPVDDAPVITAPTGNPASIAVINHNTAVTTVVATDPDGPSIAYSISGGADADKFQIDPSTGALSFLAAQDPDHPTDTDHDSHYLVTVRASDGTLFADQNIDALVQKQAGPFNWLGSPLIGPHPLGWQAAGVGDFNHDGTTDVLWREGATGRVDEWQLANGGQWQQSIPLGSHGLTWQVAGIGDFNGDGTSDVLWRDSTTGHIDLWVIVNGQWSQSKDLGSHGTDWNVLGVGDFNGDHSSDILFQNTTTGALDSWRIVDGNWAGSTPVGTHNAPWIFAGIGDANGDGSSDIFWRNPTTGQVDEWQMASGNWSRSIDLGSFNPAFQLAAVNDFNGDGNADILWRNPTTGQVEGWNLFNGQWFASSSLGSFDPASRIAGTGDINHAGGADVIWHNATTGQVNEWLLGPA